MINNVILPLPNPHSPPLNPPADPEEPNEETSAAPSQNLLEIGRIHLLFTVPASQLEKSQTGGKTEGL